jgi:hypothetical protein
MGDAIAKLRALGFFIDIEDEDIGNGLTAKGTFPVAGSKLKKGSPVVIRTS